MSDWKRLGENKSDLRNFWGEIEILRNLGGSNKDEN